MSAKIDVMRLFLGLEILSLKEMALTGSHSAAERLQAGKAWRAGESALLLIQQFLQAAKAGLLLLTCSKQIVREIEQFCTLRQNLNQDWRQCQTLVQERELQGVSREPTSLLASTAVISQLEQSAASRCILTGAAPGGRRGARISGGPAAAGRQCHLLGA